MVDNSAALPEGAGSRTAQSNPGYSATGIHREPEFGGVHRPGGREVVLTDESRRPATATVVAAAVVGAIAGGAIPFMLAGRSSSGSTRTEREDTVITESVIIDRPAREIYDFWRNFENLPQFMDNIVSVETLSPTRSHWTIKAPAGANVEFDSRVTDDVPGRSISWQSEEGASVPNSGRVEFIETSSGAGTNVRVTIAYDPPAGVAGRAVAKLFQREPSVQAREDLARLKALLERR